MVDSIIILLVLLTHAYNLQEFKGLYDTKVVSKYFLSSAPSIKHAKSVQLKVEAPIVPLQPLSHCNRPTLRVAVLIVIGLQVVCLRVTR